MTTLAHDVQQHEAEPQPTSSGVRDGLRRTGIAGTLLVSAGIGMLMGFMTGEALYPRPFSTSANTISDLGGTLPPNSVWFQPSRSIFIGTVLLAGSMILAADVLLFRVHHRRGLAIAMGLFGVGVVGVGVFPGNIAGWHPLFSMIAFVAGSITAITSRKLLSGPFRVISVLLGAIALTATVLGSDALIDWGPGAALGVGGLERWIVYPVIFWMVGFGGYLLGVVAQGQARGETVFPAIPP